MATRILLLTMLLAGLLATGCSKHAAPVVRSRVRTFPTEDALQVVDFAQAYKSSVSKNLGGFSGRHMFDGLPFHLDSRITFYGQSQANWDLRSNPTANPDAKYPDLIGVPMNRTFQELHVIHATTWPDVDGETVAVIRLHYDDDTTCDFPIIYGAQVRDHQRIRTEESEDLSDPDSKIVWRGPGGSRFQIHGAGIQEQVHQSPPVPNRENTGCRFDPSSGGVSTAGHDGGGLGLPARCNRSGSVG